MVRRGHLLSNMAAFPPEKRQSPREGEFFPQSKSMVTKGSGALR